MGASEPVRDPVQRSELTSRRISDLSLQIPGSRLEPLVNRLYLEMDQAGISFRPSTYLSDEWGCPHGVPVIGIPFYLADLKLAELEGRFTDVEAEDEDEVMMLLRHEAGHALNYAYQFFNYRDWRRVFGRFETPYREVYRPKPFSARYVRHVPGWYVQKHPDEDFAETFAVWLTPGINWQEIYRGTAALQKLLYVDELMHMYGRTEPVNSAVQPDRPIHELQITLEDWYQSCQESSQQNIGLPEIINEDLRRLLPASEGLPAASLIQTNQKQLLRDINNWTGIDRHILKALINEIAARTGNLGLKFEAERGEAALVGITAFITTLAMNFQCRAQFVEE